MRNSWLKLPRFVLIWKKIKTRLFIGLVIFAHISTLAFSLENTGSLSKSAGVEYQRIENQIIVKINSLSFNWEQEAGVSSISLLGAEELSISGLPKIPYFSTILALPPEGFHHTSQLISTTKQISVPDNLSISPIFDTETNDEFEKEELNICEKIFPESSIQIGDPFWYRDQHLVSITFYPIRWDCQSHQFLWTKDLEIKLTLNDHVALSDNLSLNPRHDLAFQPQIINAAEALLWKAELPILWGGDLQEPWGLRARLEIEEQGIYRVTFEDLQDIQFDLDEINPNFFHLENQGRETAYLFEGDEDNLFEPGESLLFYGENFQGDYLSEMYKHQSDHWPSYGTWQPEFSALMLEKYTSTNVYWLYVAETPGFRISEVDGKPQGGVVNTIFVDQVKFEQENVWWTTHFTNEDTWFWDYLDVKTFPFTKSYTIQLVDPVISSLFDAQIEGQIVSATSSSTRNPDHHLHFLLNDLLLSDDYWDGAIRYSFSGIINQQFLLSGTNEFSFIVNSLGLPASRYGFDFVSVNYARQLRAVNEELIFNVNPMTNGDIQVSNLSSSENYLWNITDPLLPFALQNTEFDAGLLTFNQALIQPQQYILSGQAAIKTTQGLLSLYSPPNLLSTNHQADYLIISPQPFLEGLQPLVEYRSSQGYRVLLVDLQDVYNQFNFGISHPIAIKNFFGYLYQYWQSPAPQYVLLVGDGHWDLKNTRSPDEVYLPPNFVWVDPLQGEVDSLSDLVAVVGDDIFPDAMIGRMSVNNQDELEAYINKTIQFEKSSLEWKKRITFVADNYYLQDPLNYIGCVDNDPTTICPTDPAGNFPSIVNQVIAEEIDQPYLINKIFLDNYNCRATSPENCPMVTNEIIAAFNQGNQIISYNGHGAITNWASEKIFHVDHIPQISNQDLYPVVLSLDCVDGYWYFPPTLPNQTTDRRSLAEELTRVSGKGAVAMLSSPGNGYVNGQELLQRGFFSAFSNYVDPTLGTLDLSAKLNLMANHGNDSLIFTYMIFGDPALQLSPTRWGIYLPLVTR